jgi:hypothetical protein
MQVQSVNTLSNIEILNEHDYLIMTYGEPPPPPDPVVFDEVKDVQFQGQWYVDVYILYNAPLLPVGARLFNPGKSGPRFDIVVEGDGTMEVSMLSGELKFELKWVVGDGHDCFTMWRPFHGGSPTVYPTPFDAQEIAAIQAWFDDTTVDKGGNLSTGNVKVKARVGLSWEGVPSMISQRFREYGIGLQVLLSEKKTIILRDMTFIFRIEDMSYNWAVLLGFYGSGIPYPIASKERTYWTHYQDPNTPMAALSEFKIHARVHETTQVRTISLPFCHTRNDSFIAVVPYTISTNNGWPPRYRIEWYIDHWSPPNQTGWASVHQTTGTITMHYPSFEVPSSGGYTWSCDVHAKVYQGDQGTPVFHDWVALHGFDHHNSSQLEYVIGPAKPKIVFDEMIRIGFRAEAEPYTTSDLPVVDYWEIPEESKKHIRFSGAMNEAGNGKDDSHTVSIRALHKPTPELVPASVEMHTTGGQVYIARVHVIGDQVEIVAQSIEAPRVGSSLSTPQLYLTTNCGGQVFKNDMTNPTVLDAVQIAAVFQNTFSPGMQLNGGGDITITLNDQDLSNIWFELVDSNFHPVKLNSPMQVSLKVEPADDPVTDIKGWKLPKHAMTPQQKAQLEAEAAEKKKKEEEEARMKKIRDDGLDLLMAMFAPQLGGLGQGPVSQWGQQELGVPTPGAPQPQQLPELPQQLPDNIDDLERLMNIVPGIL